MANGKRGRAPKPTALLKLNGTYRADRHGSQLPEPTGKPSRPEGLSTLAMQFWDAVIPGLIELGVATSVDQKQLEAMADWWADYETARRDAITCEAGLHELAESVRSLTDAMWAINDESGAVIGDQVLRDIGSILDGHERREKARVARKQLAWAEFTRISAKFGMTPADRRGLEGLKGKDTNPFAEYLEARKALSKGAAG